MLSKKILLSFLISFLLSFIFTYKIGSIYAKKPSSGDRKVEQSTRPVNKIVPSTTPTPTSFYRKTGKSMWVGKVSHYSVSGCLGCSSTLTMANGETLDDNKPTIAFNWLPMNTKVLVTNLDNGKTIEAIVTDTGGFNSLGRIADLTPAVSNYLDTKTDVTEVKIEILK